MKRLAPLILLGLAACVTVDTDPLSLAHRTSSQPVVERALGQPMADLYAAAAPTGRVAKADDELALGLALLAGRDNREAVDATGRVVVDSKLTADLAVAYANRLPVVDAPPPADAVIWARQTAADLDACTPCSIDTPVVVPWDDVQQPMVTDYTHATSARYWLDLARGAETGSTMTAIYVPPMRVGGAGSTMLVNMPSRPLIDPALYLAARYCVTAVRSSLTTDAALAWLQTDVVTASGRRLVLDNALTEALSAKKAANSGQYCADGSFDHLRGLLAADRPDLATQVAGFLVQRLDDPRQASM